MSQVRRAWLSLTFLAFLGVPTGADAQSCLDDPLIAPKVGASLRVALTDGVNAFWVGMVEQADVSGALALKTKVEKTRYVYEKARRVADRTQPAVLAQIRALGLDYRAHFSANAILVHTRDTQVIVEAHPEPICAIAAMAGVALLESTVDSSPLFEPPSCGSADPCFDNPGPMGLGVAWNLDYIHVPDVWAQGVTGRGVVVASIDTGVKWDHPLLKRQYRGWHGPKNDVDHDGDDDADDEADGRHQRGHAHHDYNWWDAFRDQVPADDTCGAASPFPCDDRGHGTHTMGIMVGDDGNGTIVGAAPGATWISCRGFIEGQIVRDGVLECLDFMLAPWDGNRRHANPDKAPDIISNSYGFADRPWWFHAFGNLIAAGIEMVGAAGNAGRCRSIVGAPGTYSDVLAVGALSGRSDRIALFSSKGPGAAAYTLQKPDVAAPGQGIPSADFAGFVAAMSGTSMAAPLVAGTVALAWSANHRLQGDVPETNALVRQTARPILSSQCGTPTFTPNYLFGYGVIDAAHVVQAAKNLKIDKKKTREEK